MRKYGKNTQTWRLFEQYFLSPAPEDYPLVIPNLTKGQALNLSIGLNRCHCQHAEEQGMPSEAMLYSAKPSAASDGSGWIITISTNYTRQGIEKPSRARRGGNAAWMDALVSEAASPLDPPGVLTLPGNAQEGVAPPQPSLPLPDAMESLLGALYPEQDKK